MGGVVGAVVGTVVGAVVGTVVGAVVGTVVGAVVGTVVGAVVGTAVGEVVGTVVGTAEDAVVGSVVGKAISSVVAVAPVVEYVSDKLLVGSVVLVVGAIMSAKITNTIMAMTFGVPFMNLQRISCHLLIGATAEAQIRKRMLEKLGEAPNARISKKAKANQSATFFSVLMVLFAVLLSFPAVMAIVKYFTQSQIQPIPNNPTVKRYSKPIPIFFSLNL